mmetsp:Transcript_54409/g.61561  ORF Transcript_54409/g.61561 Transcript_54409/m.61561 type:complete len:102 (+) Transcript_54409:843-1148(+)
MLLLRLKNENEKKMKKESEKGKEDDTLFQTTTITMVCRFGRPQYAQSKGKHLSRCDTIRCDQLSTHFVPTQRRSRGTKHNTTQHKIGTVARAATRNKQLME